MVINGFIHTYYTDEKSIQIHFGTFQNISEHFRNILVHFRTFQKISEHFRIFQNIFRTFLEHF